MTGSAADTTAGSGVTLGGTGAGSSSGNTDVGAGGAGAGATGSPSGNGSPWYGTIEDAGLKTWAESKGWKSPADALKSHKDLEVSYSQRTTASQAPKDASEYKFAAPQDMPKEAYNTKFAEWFRGAAHKAGLSQELAGGLHDAFVGYAKEAFTASAQAQQQKLAESVTKAVAELETAWGGKQDTPNFKRNLELAQRAMRMADPTGKLKEALTELGAIVKVDGKDTITNAKVFDTLAKMGAGMYQEDALYGDPASDKNPFDDKTQDLAMQGRLMRSDPGKAANLIHAAGKSQMFAQWLAKQK